MRTWLVVPVLITGVWLLSGCNDSGGKGGSNMQGEVGNVSSQTRAIAASPLEESEPQEVDHLMIDTAEDQEPVEI